MAEWVKIAKVGDIPPGTVKVVGSGRRHIALCHVDGGFYAIADVCTHDGGPLGEGELYGDEIECPRHGARFDVRTGAVLSLPAVKPVASYPVRVEGSDIYVELG